MHLMEFGIGYSSLMFSCLLSLYVRMVSDTSRKSACRGKEGLEGGYVLLNIREYLRRAPFGDEDDELSKSFGLGLIY